MSSPSISGYKYGTSYIRSSSISWHNNTGFTNTGRVYLWDESFSNSYYYADSVYYDSTTKKYTLVNPYLFTGSDYSSLIGKYTLYNSDSTYSSELLYYISAIEDNTIYSIRYYETPSQNLPLFYYMSDSITDNGDGTYTLDNPTAVSGQEWYNNYSNYMHKFTCDEIGTTTCTTPFFIVPSHTDNSTFYHFDASIEITIGKSRNGLTLLNPITIKAYDFLLNKENYSEYKYTCGNTDTVCTDSNIKYIKSITDNGYNYVKNYYFANKATYDGTNYHLTDYISAMENYNNIPIFSNYHYLCSGGSGKLECDSIYYVYRINSGNENNWIYHIRVNDGTIDIDDIFHNMSEINTNDSAIKRVIEYWYRNNLLQYRNQIDDTIYCNDRSSSETGGWYNGGDITSYLRYNSYSSSNELTCSKETDRFSTTNVLAQTDYPIGLITKSELDMLGSITLYKTNDEYWTMSPSYPGDELIYNYSVNTSGWFSSKSVSSNLGIRPSISLSSSTFYTSGDGSMETPYVIYTE